MVLLFYLFIISYYGVKGKKLAPGAPSRLIMIKNVREEETVSSVSAAFRVPWRLPGGEKS